MRAWRCAAAYRSRSSGRRTRMRSSARTRWLVSFRPACVRIAGGSVRGKEVGIIWQLIDLREWSNRSGIVNWVRVKSRMLAAVAYNHDWRHLYLEFRSGDVYCYRGVPVDRYEELLAADSKG